MKWIGTNTQRLREYRIRVETNDRKNIITSVPWTEEDRITKRNWDENIVDKCYDIPYSPNRLLVRLIHLDVVHVRLPVLDVAAVVSSHHPAIIVRPDHGTDGGVMSLQTQKPRLKHAKHPSSSGMIADQLKLPPNSTGPEGAKTMHKHDLMVPFLI